MKRGLIIILLFSYVNVYAQTIKLISKTTKGSELTLSTYGEGVLSIDWGTGTPINTESGIAKGIFGGDTIRITLSEGITSLDCSNCRIKWIDVNDANQLITLDCSNNDIENIDISCLETLEELNCSNNALTKLDISNNSRLRYLDCSDNNIEALNLNNNKALETLICSNNKLSELNTYNNPYLCSLWANDNTINNLNLTTNGNLNSVIVSNNDINDLLFNNIRGIEDLWAENNKLNSLDLSNSSSFITINISNNQLDSLNLEGYNGSQIIWLFDCANNHLAMSSFLPNTLVKNYKGGLQESVYCGFDTLELNKYYQMKKMFSNITGTKIASVTAWDAKTKEQLTKGSSSTNDYSCTQDKINFHKTFSSVYLEFTSSKISDLLIRTKPFTVIDKSLEGVYSASVPKHLYVKSNDNGLILWGDKQKIIIHNIKGVAVWNGNIDNMPKTISLQKGFYIINGEIWEVK